MSLRVHRKNSTRHAACLVANAENSLHVIFTFHIYTLLLDSSLQYMRRRKVINDVLVYYVKKRSP